MKVTDGIRIAFSVIWLVFMWPHAHWSISVSIAGLTLANELQSWLVDQHFQILKQVVENLSEYFGKKSGRL